MKTTFFLFLIVLVIPTKANNLLSHHDSISYALGIVWVNDLKRNNIKIDIENFYQGVMSFYQGDTSITTLKKAYDYLEKQNAKLSNKKYSIDTVSYILGFTYASQLYAQGFKMPNDKLKNAMYSNNIEKYETSKIILNNELEKIRENTFRGIKILNENWLLENLNKDSIQLLTNNIQYKILKKGNCFNKPVKHNILLIKYKAQLIDGTIFDKTNGIERFYLSALITGLQKTLLDMCLGEIRIVYLPYTMAFGSGGIRDLVPPFSTVIYTIELIGIE